MNRTFYRYIRPIYFDESRLDFITLPNGGVCLRFEELTDGGTLFTYSRCHPEDHFNKIVARTIADRRADVAHSDPRLLDTMSIDVVGSQDTDLLVADVITLCRAFDPATSDFLVGHYLSIEWLGLAEALEKIVYNNLAQRRKADIWLAAAQAMGSISIYSKP